MTQGLISKPYPMCLTAAHTIGLLITGIGLVWLFTPSITVLGKLPGDVRIERENLRFYFPLMTCILLSLLVTGIMWLVQCFSQE